MLKTDKKLLSFLFILSAFNINSKNKLHKPLKEAYLIRSHHPAEHAHVLKRDILKEIYDSNAFAS